MVQDLINAYGVLNPNKVLIISKCSATEDELKTFHSSSYIDFLKKVNDCNDSIEFENEQLEFGLGYDCPLLAKNFDFVKVVGGSSLTAAKLLNTEKFKFAINWFGGWHHAQRCEVRYYNKRKLIKLLEIAEMQLKDSATLMI